MECNFKFWEGDNVVIYNYWGRLFPLTLYGGYGPGSLQCQSNDNGLTTSVTDQEDKNKAKWWTIRQCLCEVMSWVYEQFVKSIGL